MENLIDYINFKLSTTINDTELRALLADFCHFCKEHGDGWFTDNHTEMLTLNTDIFDLLPASRLYSIKSPICRWLDVAHCDMVAPFNLNSFGSVIGADDEDDDDYIPEEVEENYLSIALSAVSVIEFYALLDNLYHSNISADQLVTMKQINEELHNGDRIVMHYLGTGSNWELSFCWDDVKEAWNVLHPESKI